MHALVSVESIKNFAHIVERNVDIQGIASSTCRRIDVKRTSENELYWILWHSESRCSLIAGLEKITKDEISFISRKIKDFLLAMGTVWFLWRVFESLYMSLIEM